MLRTIKMTNISDLFMYICAAIWTIPLIWVIVTAFRPKALAISPGFSLDFTLANFTKVWSAAPFLQYFINTVVIVICVFLVQMLTATMGAFAFSRVRFWGRDGVFLH